MVNIALRIGSDLTELIEANRRLRDLEFTDVPVLRSGSGQICCTRLSKTAGVAGYAEDFVIEGAAKMAGR